MPFASQHASNAYQARLDAAPTPRMLPSRIVDHLMSTGADLQILRMKTEMGLLGEVDYKRDALTTRIFKLTEGQQALHIDLQAANQNQSAREIKTATAALAEVGGLLAQARSEQSPLGGSAKQLNDRQTSCKKLILSRIVGSPLKFLDPPKIDGKLTLAAAREPI
jgi:hypothetical protein